MRYVLMWQNWKGETLAKDSVDAETLRDAIHAAWKLCPEIDGVLNVDIVLLVEAECKNS